jgi:hypothetical protein
LVSKYPLHHKEEVFLDGVLVELATDPEARHRVWVERPDHGGHENIVPLY